ncbi:MAG TPA: DUF3987 domain-containing protein, partial [Gemmataceae bacterium]|nr:DUF3987 domain-containing protein [Gemmataceae bacterium]
MHRAGSMTLDRKTEGQETVHVPRAFVAVTGSVQPGTLRRALTPEHFEAGLTARLLVAMPPRRPRQWSEMEIDPDTRQAVARVFDNLWSLKPEGDGDEQKPAPVRLDADAKAAFVRFFDQHGAEQFDRTGNLAAAWSKLEGYCGRLALIIHLARWAAGDVLNEIDAASIDAAVTLVRWFGMETERVYTVLSEGEQEQQNRQLLDWVRDRGSVTVRDLQRAFPRLYPNAETAETALKQLAGTGKVQPITQAPGPHGGRPATVYQAC